MKSWIVQYRLHKIIYFPEKICLHIFFGWQITNTMKFIINCMYYPTVESLTLQTMMIMMNCFGAMVDRQKAFILISNQGYCQTFSLSQISNMPQAVFEPAQNLSSDFAWIPNLFLPNLFFWTFRPYPGPSYIAKIWKQSNKWLYRYYMYTIFIQSQLTLTGNLLQHLN